MTNLFIDDKAIDFIKDYMGREDADALRIFVGGGGCCKWLEIAAVRKALAGDVTYNEGGLTLHVDKALVAGTSTIKITFDEQQKELLIDLLE
jgi:Fe-S cluster assembly iron-binding protein IscA